MYIFMSLKNRARSVKYIWLLCVVVVFHLCWSFCFSACGRRFPSVSQSPAPALFLLRFFALKRRSSSSSENSMNWKKECNEFIITDGSFLLNRSILYYTYLQVVKLCHLITVHSQSSVIRQKHLRHLRLFVKLTEHGNVDTIHIW